MLTPKTKTIETLRGRYDPYTDTGYMGYVSAYEFITGEQLANQLNFHAGDDQNTDIGWLKFYVGPRAVCNKTNTQKVLFIAKKSLKCKVSWDNINEVGLVDGTHYITIKEKSYSVRLMTGGAYDASTDSEWNQLLYRVHSGPHNENFNWETFDPKLETNITSGYGRYVWCQEKEPTKPSMLASSKPAGRVLRGSGDLTIRTYYAPHAALLHLGWRPVLELVG